MTISVSPHIILDDRGLAWVDDTNIKVIEVVLSQKAGGASPEELHLQYPHLSVAQIYAALAYYHDHKEEMDAHIQASLQAFDQGRAQNQDSPGRRRLRAMGYLP